jgi:hypothetical protein
MGWAGLFAKLDLGHEAHVDRRIMAVLTFLRDPGASAG